MANPPKNLWYKDAVFYELYVRAFYDSNGDGQGDLPGIVQKLDYLKDLGIDCIWLLPFYPSPLKDDGYDITDYRGVHPDYGNLEDFERLIWEAHTRGLRVITDLVINHTSDQHSWFVESRSSRTSPKRDWYVWSDTDKRYSRARIIFLDTETSNWAYDEPTGQYYWHRFYAFQPDLNYDNPDVRQAVLDVMRFWLEKGIDGFRVDAVPYLFEREGTNCENLAETHAYLKEMRRFIEVNYPEAILLAEANQRPEDVRAYFGAGDEFHMAFHFPLMPRIFMALAVENAQPIHDVMERTPIIPDSCQWCTFLRNHDELTLEMVTDEERHTLWSVYAPDARMRLNLGIRRRLAPLLENDPRRIMLANQILFSLPGTPIIYYGDEIGMGDNISLPDRRGVRTPMQWEGGPNAGFSGAPSQKLYAPVLNDPIYGYRTLNVASQQADPGSLFHAMRSLIALRKRHGVLAYGSLSFLDVENPAVLAIVRSFEGETVLVVHNLSSAVQETTLDTTVFSEIEPINMQEISPSLSRGKAPSSYHLILTPYQSVWLLARLP